MTRPKLTGPIMPSFKGMNEIITLRATLNFIIGYADKDEDDLLSVTIVKLARAGIAAADMARRRRLSR